MKVRFYIIAYMVLDTHTNTNITHDTIEQFVKDEKCHRIMTDQDIKYTHTVWKNSIGIE